MPCTVLGSTFAEQMAVVMFTVMRTISAGKEISTPVVQMLMREAIVIDKDRRTKSPRSLVDGRLGSFPETGFREVTNPGNSRLRNLGDNADFPVLISSMSGLTIYHSSRRS